MDTDRKVLRLCAVVIVCAVVLRLLGGTDFGAALLGSQRVSSAIIFLGTGRLVKAADPAEAPAGQISETQPDTLLLSDTQEAVKTPLTFTAADAQGIRLTNYPGYSVDLSELLLQPLSWDLTEDGPAVLILHSHATESYLNTEGYTESSDYRTLDEDYNMISIGDRVAEILEAGGVEVLHDRTLHDYPSYNGSYTDSRKTVEAYLEQYPSIRMVLDLHRDAAEDASGKQISYTVQTELGKAATLMLVVGTNGGGTNHPNWRENLALGVKLYAQLERLTPGICRPISLRNSRFNQDLSTGALLVEVGAAGNTRQEALVAAEILAQAILDLAYGTSG